MCGIAGIYGLRGRVRPEWIGTMTERLRHRGPDDEGYVLFDTATGACEEAKGNDTVEPLRTALRHIGNPSLDANMAWGHRRLSIIDLSPLGHQPMSYGDGNYWIVFNGEIFNYIELKKELKDSGYGFATSSDTEVILAAYQRWGFDCTTHFNGDWAFCIYDRIRNILFLSRDRYGVRFLYYYLDGDVFAFASEIKALLTFPRIQVVPDARQLSQFLMFGLMDHGDATMYHGISQLKPAHNLVFNLGTAQSTLTPYYSIAFNSDLGTYSDGKAQEIAHHVHDLLLDAVRIRLRADVPVGTCLSGGLDSSTIVMMINRLITEMGTNTTQIGARQKTFTASYRDDPVDETGYVRDIISTADMDSKFIFPEGTRLWDEFDHLLSMQEGPYTSTSVYAQWVVMSLASRYVKVVLDGQGGDELFGGYLAHFPFAMAQGNWKLVRERLAVSGRAALRDLYLAMGIRYIPDQWKGRSFALLRQKYFKRLCSLFPQFSSHTWDVEEIVADVAKPNLNSRLFLDMKKYTIPQLLHYEDRNGMAFSIESRFPFLDFRLVDYVMNVPAIYKIYNGWSKWVFRLSVKDLLPERILWRKDKLGFTTPERKWLSDGRNPFTQFCAAHEISYDGDPFWWRSFIATYWLDKMEHTGR
jgi:asparagine synthase (glutamine-hydrolysing)